MGEPNLNMLLQKSLIRCASKDNFIPAFYRYFMSSSDEIQSMFENTDFDKQNKMLIRSLSLTATAATGNPESLRELKERAKSHDRHHLNIEPRFYTLWLEAIVKAASENDPKWNAGVETAWRTIFGHVVKHMIKNY